MPAEAKPNYYERRTLDRNLGDRYLRLLQGRFPLLEVGCGSTSVANVSAACGLVVGLDNDIGALRRRGQPGLVLDLEDRRLPFRDGAFGSVLAKDVLEHVQRPWLLLREIHRVVAVDGRLLASVPMARPSRVWDDYTHIRGFTVRALEDMLRDSGFQPLETVVMGGVPLAGRLGFAQWLPQLMRIPFAALVFGRSYEILATRV
ncbi:MAG: class I SAM-dependent methyltransferase [Myxococcales bacterium]